MVVHPFFSTRLLQKEADHSPSTPRPRLFVPSRITPLDESSNEARLSFVFANQTFFFIGRSFWPASIVRLDSIPRLVRGRDKAGLFVFFFLLFFPRENVAFFFDRFSLQGWIISGWTFDFRRWYTEIWGVKGRWWCEEGREGVKWWCRVGKVCK